MYNQLPKSPCTTAVPKRLPMLALAEKHTEKNNKYSSNTAERLDEQMENEGTQKNQKIKLRKKDSQFIAFAILAPLRPDDSMPS